MVNGETWVSWYRRCLRAAEDAIHSAGLDIASEAVFRKRWRWAGHLARLPAGQARWAKDLLLWRGLHWWRFQQTLPNGVRHVECFRTWRWEEIFEQFLGTPDWMSIAADRDQWRLMEGGFVVSCR